MANEKEIAKNATNGQKLQDKLRKRERETKVD